MANDGVTQVGKYRVLEQVGEGAMGVVYRALDPVLNRPVAIKVMSDALARDDDLRSRFLREAQAAGSLQHPNVVTIYDFGEMEGHLYIAMEFVVGDDLEEMLRRNALLSVVEKIDLLIDVLGGLGYAHKRGIIHRDIKPANIRVDEEGRARIMDFGIAHLQSSKLTRTGLMVGTPAYMAPEQITGGTVSPATDLFSVGAVMYELLTGNRPFEAESLQSVFYHIVTTPPPDIMTVVPELPPVLNQIVMRALAKEPAERYSSALEMANALTRARASIDRRPSQRTRLSLNSAIASGLSTRPTRKIFIPRSRMALVVGVAAAAVAVVAIGGILYKLGSRSARAPDAPITASAATQAGAVDRAPGLTPFPSSDVKPETSITAKPAPAAAPSRSSADPAARKPAGPTADEIALLRSLQTAAAAVRRSASDAGATAEQLRAGDDHAAAAAVATRQGKTSEAATRLNLASSAWAAAERDVRAAAAAAAQAKVAAEPDPKRQMPVLPPPAAVVQAPPTPRTVAPSPAATPIAAPKPPPNPSVEIQSVVAAYARAIESRDVGEVRRAYPGATQTQLDGFAQFFKTVRSMRATFSVSSLDVRGESADALLSGVYEYVTTNGKNERQPVTFQAGFRHDGGIWKLTSVR